MDSRYRLINDCLQVLRSCDIPSTQKLRLEVQLFQIKLLLLSDDVSGDVKARYCNDVVLQELHGEMVALRGREVSAVGIEALTRTLMQIAVDLAREPVEECVGSGQ